MKHKYYCSNGLITNKKPDNEFYIDCFMEHDSFPGDNFIEDLDHLIITLDDHFKSKIVGEDIFDSTHKHVPDWIITGGLDADSGIDKDTFNEFLRKNTNEINNKYLLLYDLMSINSSIQNRFIECNELFIAFYKAFCSLDYEKILIERFNDNVFYSIGPNERIVYSFLENLIIKIYSLSLFQKSLKRRKINKNGRSPVYCLSTKKNKTQENFCHENYNRNPGRWANTFPHQLRYPKVFSRVA